MAKLFIVFTVMGTSTSNCHSHGQSIARNYQQISTHYHEKKKSKQPHNTGNYRHTSRHHQETPAIKRE